MRKFYFWFSNEISVFMKKYISSTNTGEGAEANGTDEGLLPSKFATGIFNC